MPLLFSPDRGADFVCLRRIRFRFIRGKWPKVMGWRRAEMRHWLAAFARYPTPVRLNIWFYDIGNIEFTSMVIHTRNRKIFWFNVGIFSYPQRIRGRLWFDFAQNWRPFDRFHESCTNMFSLINQSLLYKRQLEFIITILIQKTKREIIFCEQI
jgi:hypothetical protein